MIPGRLELLEDPTSDDANRQSKRLIGNVSYSKLLIGLDGNEALPRTQAEHHLWRDFSVSTNGGVDQSTSLILRTYY
jgi:hypothetical protein